jgi:hypothetical protein
MVRNELSPIENYIFNNLKLEIGEFVYENKKLFGLSNVKFFEEMNGFNIKRLLDVKEGRLNMTLKTLVRLGNIFNRRPHIVWVTIEDSIKENIGEKMRNDKDYDKIYRVKRPPSAWIYNPIELIPAPGPGLSVQVIGNDTRTGELMYVIVRSEK